MPDISMCREECKRSSTCYRAIASPGEYQYYAQFNPEDCKFYWPTYKCPICGKQSTNQSYCTYCHKQIE